MKILQRPQFTGYKNVDMLDADASELTKPSAGTPSDPASRSSSSSHDNLPTDASYPTGAPSKNDPYVSPPEGPSGGASGLDDNRMCGYCGSFSHMTHNCNNIDAKEAARGNCYRCGQPGHTRAVCISERCLECGEAGHVARDCKSTRVLSKQEKQRIAREEYHHTQMQKQRAERQRARQLGGHDPKVPVIQVTSAPNEKNPEQPKTDSKGAAKRKRTNSPSSDTAKPPKRKPDHNVPPTGPKNPRRKIDANVPLNTEVGHYFQLHIELC